MSQSQQDSGNLTSGTDNYNRRDGFNDSQGGVESYGAGSGSGAYDPANTGLGGYGNQRGGFDGPDTATGTSGGFNNAPNWSSDASREGKKDEGFADGPSGGAGGGTYGSGAGAGATDPGNTGLGGYDPSNAQTHEDDVGPGKGGSNTAPATSDINEFKAQMDAEFNKGERERERERQRQPDQPTTGDRLRGTAEQWAGQITGDTDLQARGEQRRSGGGDQF